MFIVEWLEGSGKQRVNEEKKEKTCIYCKKKKKKILERTRIMEGFELFRSGRVSWCKPFSFPESLFASSFQTLEIETEVGASEHVLEEVKVAFHFAPFSYEPRWSGGQKGQSTTY